MTNRILWILILILVFWAWYLYYVFQYKPKKELENLQKQQEIQLQEIKKEITLDKVNINEEKIENTWSINNEEITKINENQNKEVQKYSTFNLPNLWEFYFTEENNKLNLFLEEENLWSFDLVKKEDLQIQEIIWNNNYIFIKTGESKYLYNLLSKEIKKLDIKLEIEYIKIWQNDLEFLLKTSVWIFIYSSQNDEINYFTFFEDFIYFKTWYIWIINSTEETKLKNLDLQNENDNLIIFYDPDTKEKNILFRTNLKLNKVYLEQNNVFFETDSQEKYELNNIY